MVPAGGLSSEFTTARTIADRKRCRAGSFARTDRSIEFLAARKFPPLNTGNTFSAYFRMKAAPRVDPPTPKEKKTAQKIDLAVFLSLSLLVVLRAAVNRTVRGSACQMSLPRRFPFSVSNARPEFSP